MRREVAAGNLTQAEADENLRPYCVGWYKSIQNLQKKIAEAEGGSAEKGEAELQLQQTLQENAELAEAALRSLDCSLVFGYTKYASSRQQRLLDYLTLANAFAGLYWYALFVPALSKRLFR